MRTPWLVLALVGIGGIAAAEDAPPPSPTAPPAAPEAPSPAAQPAERQKADAVLAAVGSKDDAALKALGKNDVVDPWLVADELIRRGEFDAATAFAKAAPQPDVEALPDYVERRRTGGADAGDRALLAEVMAAISSRNAKEVLARTEALAPEVDTLVRVQLRDARCGALAASGRLRDCALALRSTAEAAVALGWLRRGALLYDAAVMFAIDASENTQALEMLEVCLPLNERRGDRAYAARSLVHLGVLRTRLGEIPRAVAAFDEAIARFEALRSKRGLAWALRVAADTYLQFEERARELPLRERLQPLLEELGDRRGAGENINIIGTALNELGEHDKALVRFKDALARVQALGDRAAEAGCLVNMGNAYRGLGDRVSALTHYERGRALAEEVGHRLWLLNARVGIALLHLDSGEHAKALATFTQILAQQEREGDKAGAASTVSRIAHVHATRGDFSKAVSTLQQALERHDALGDQRGAAGALLSLGLAYAGLGDGARALSTQEQALARWQALGDKAGESGALINIGNAYRDLGDSTSARAHYQRGLALAEQAGQRQWRANALANIAATDLDSGEPERALAGLQQSLADNESVGDQVGVTKTYRNIGSAYWGMGEFAKALAQFLKALERSERAGDSWMVALTLTDVGCAYASLKDFEKAQEYLERSERVARSRRLASLLAGALTNLAKVHFERGETDLALRVAKDALRETENLLGGLDEELGATARARHTDLFALGTLAAVREKETAAALLFLESGRAGALLDDLDRREALRWKAETLSPELARLDAEAQSRERAARDAHEQASRGGNLRAQQEAGRALDDAAQGVQEVAGRIQRELKLQTAFFYPRATTIEEIQSALTADQALVLYGLCHEEALALVLRPDGERVVALGKVADVVAACEALDARDLDTDPTPALDTLRRQLVEPLALEEGVKQVLVSPEGPLCYLPFALLFSQTVALTPSGTTHVLLLDERGDPGRGVLALGDPDYAGVSSGSQAVYYRGRALTQLPGTRREAATIGAPTLLGANASETRLKELLPTSTRWRAIHFACHGLVNIDKPMLSSLALTRAGDGDGFFTALEVLRTKIPADLVVLSACETATGKIVSGEGIVGMTRAFMFAGSQRVICSLWKVDDEATMALMVKFYELWNPKDGSTGLPTAVALRKAQEHVRSQEKWKHPYFWAAWVLWGLPD
jgi:CHAT domain-containing protein